MRDRAIRRLYDDRRKAEVRRQFADWPGCVFDPVWVAKRATTRGQCSCYLCGHTRLHKGPTIQERRAALD